MKPLFPPERKNVIFFDLNGTLTEPRSRTYARSFVQAVQEFTARWESAGRSIEPETVWRRYEREWKQRAGSRPFTDPGLTSNRHTCLKLALADAPFAVTASFADSFFRRARELLPLIAEPAPGAAAALRKLARHYRLAIISNGAKPQIARTLDRLGLRELIPESHVFASTKRTIRKPQPAIYRQALRTMGVTPDQAVMVGDSWHTDIAGAVRSGLDAVWVTNGAKKSSRRKNGRERVVVIQNMNRLTGLFID